MSLSLKQIRNKAVEESILAGGNADRDYIERELLHLDLLNSFINQETLKSITFQGGTALRLCYGNPRYSEDLDFAIGDDISLCKSLRISELIETNLKKLYGEAFSLKKPKDSAFKQKKGEIKTPKWFAKYNMIPEIRSAPLQKVKLEIASVPAHSRLYKSARYNYPNMEKHFPSLSLYVESLDEIMADKIVSFAMSNYIRWRDLWDMNWILNNPEYSGNENNYLLLKLKDYSIDDISGPLQEKLRLIPDLIDSKEFFEQTSRFFPASISRNYLQSPSFQHEMENAVTGIYKKALSTIHCQKTTAKDQLVIYTHQQNKHISLPRKNNEINRDER